MNILINKAKEGGGGGGGKQNVNKTGRSKKLVVIRTGQPMGGKIENCARYGILKRK